MVYILKKTITRRDVAILFHAHCLCPFHFSETVLSRKHLGGLAFPLERLHSLISNGQWSDQGSEEIWQKALSSPYQLWNEDPSKVGALELQNIEITCPSCSAYVVIDLHNWIDMRANEVLLKQCPTCLSSFRPRCLTTQSQGYDSSRSIYLTPIRQSADDIISCADTAIILSDVVSKNSFITMLHAKLIALSHWFLGLYLPAIDDSPRTMVPRIVWQGLSVDLVRASLIQRMFATRITGREGRDLRLPFALHRATIRYHKFILLMDPSSPSRGKVLVPTLDIDLCWHTHQLSAPDYRRWCIEHAGGPVDHNDTITTLSLAAGIHYTSLSWLAAYHEAYTTTNMRLQYLTLSRIIVGVLFPPYGIYMLWRAYKLNKARIDPQVWKNDAVTGGKYLVTVADHHPENSKMTSTRESSPHLNESDVSG